MTSSRTLAIVAVVLALVLLVLAVVYVAEPARSLPSFIPGHQAGSGHHHVKHGIASLVVALGLLAFAWFRTGPAGQRAAS